MNFDQSFEALLGHEGTYSNDPKDPGGETMFGISHRAYPGEDIRGMTLERAKFLYKRDYWGAAGCDTVPDVLKFDLFDMAVNQGVKPAVRALQHAVGVTEDGILGPATLRALSTTPLPRLMFRFDAARLVAYTQVDDARWLRFGRGWVKRVASNMTVTPV